MAQTHRGLIRSVVRDGVGGTVVRVEDGPQHLWAGTESHIISPAGYGLSDCRNLRGTQAELAKPSSAQNRIAQRMDRPR